MLWIKTLAKQIETTSLGTAISQSAWMFPTIETIHVIAIVLVVGSIAILDLRLLGLSWTRRPVVEVAGEVLPWTWSAFIVAVLTGSLMFVSAASKYAVNPPFLLKMGLMGLAGINMAVFHRISFPQADGWMPGEKTPAAARLAGALSLVFWIAIVACGRLIGFTTQ